MTETDIANLALSSLGSERPVHSLEADTSKEAGLCRAWMPTARRNVLAAAFWSGLVKSTGPLNGEPATGGLFRYHLHREGWLKAEAVDADTLKPLDIAGADGHSLLLPAARASFRFVEDSDDTETWPHSVVAAVAAQLAKLIAASLTGSRPLTADADARARDALSIARAENANLTRRHGEPNPYAAARRSEGWS